MVFASAVESGPSQLQTPPGEALGSPVRLVAVKAVQLDPVLRERLAEQGIRVEQFDVDVFDHAKGQRSDGQAEQHEQVATGP